MKSKNETEKKIISLHKVNVFQIIAYTLLLLLNIAEMVFDVNDTADCIMWLVFGVTAIYSFSLLFSKNLEKKDELYIANENKASDISVCILAVVVLFTGIVSDILNLNLKIPVNFNTCFIAVSALYILLNVVFLIVDRKSKLFDDEEE